MVFMTLKSIVFKKLCLFSFVYLLPGLVNYRPLIRYLLTKEGVSVQNPMFSHNCQFQRIIVLLASTRVLQKKNLFLIFVYI